MHSSELFEQTTPVTDRYSAGRPPTPPRGMLIAIHRVMIVERPSIASLTRRSSPDFAVADGRKVTISGHFFAYNGYSCVLRSHRTRCPRAGSACWTGSAGQSVDADAG
jgi:hypothetical protein